MKRPATPQAARAVARRVAEIGPFEVMEILSRAHALEAAGRRVVHMEIGEPDFTAPAPVVEAGVRALREGMTAYTGALGLPALRETIAAHYHARFGAAVSPGRIAVTAGASGALLLTMALYVDRDDEVLVPDPGYPGYRHIVRAFEGRPRALNVDAGAGFQPTLDAVARAWGPRTVGLLLGSPANPCGTLIAPDELRRIAEFIAVRGGVLIVDEIYQGLVYGQAPATAAQHAALAAFTPESLAILEARRAEFERRRDFLVPAIEAAGLRIPSWPQGAFYVYADCSAFSRDGRKFVLDLLDQEAVAATPGADFGDHATQHFLRFAYTRALAELEEGARRLSRFCAAADRKASSARPA